MKATRIGHQSRKLVLALVLVTAAGAVHTESVSAFTVGGSGQPGVVSVYRTLGQPAVNNLVGTPKINSQGFKVYRSAASSGTQYITVSWRVWEYKVGVWYLHSSPQLTWTALAGQYVDFAGWNTTVLGGLFAVDYRIVWQNAAGTVIGTRFLDFVNASDYGCAAGNNCYVTYDSLARQYLLSVS